MKKVALFLLVLTGFFLASHHRVQSQTVTGTDSIFTGMCTTIQLDQSNPFPNPLFPDRFGCAPIPSGLASFGIPLGSPGTLKKLRLVRDSTSADSLSGTVYLNGSATTLSCTMAASQFSCSDDVDRISVVADDQVFLVVSQISSVNFSTSRNVRGSFEKKN